MMMSASEELTGLFLDWWWEQPVDDVPGADAAVQDVRNMVALLAAPEHRGLLARFAVEVGAFTQPVLGIDYDGDDTGVSGVVEVSNPPVLRVVYRNDNGRRFTRFVPLWRAAES